MWTIYRNNNNKKDMGLREWLSESNRWKHLVGGMVIGCFANGWYCAMYAGAGVAAALELKDRLWGGKWDWIDFALTTVGAAVGQLIGMAVWNG